jgi:hypothetical protein
MVHPVYLFHKKIEMVTECPTAIVRYTIIPELFENFKSIRLEMGVFFARAVKLDSPGTYILFLK